MPWYGVHVVVRVKFKDGNQSPIPAWENVYLIEAENPDEAEMKGAALGRLHNGDSDGTFHWDDRPASLAYAGVRKVIEVSEMQRDRSEHPGDGTEVTYQTFEFDSDEQLNLFLNDETVLARLVD